MAKDLVALYYPELEALSKRSAIHDPLPSLTEIHLNFFQNIAAAEKSLYIHKEFPFSYYSEHLKKDYF